MYSIERAMNIAKNRRWIVLVLALCVVVALCLYVIYFLQGEAIARSGASAIRRVCEVSFALQDVDSRRFNVESAVYKCGFPLEVCRAITVDSSILDSPLILQRLIGHIQEPCKTVAYAKELLSDARTMQLIKEAELIFQCSKPEHRQVGITIRYVTGTDHTSRRIVSQQIVTVKTGATQREQSHLMPR